MFPVAKSSLRRCLIGMLGNAAIWRARILTGRVCRNVSPRVPARRETGPPDLSLLLMMRFAGMR